MGIVPESARARAVAALLSGTDVDGDALTYRIVTAPAQGTLAGTAPTLSADIDFNDLDLLRLTEVFDFGSITGKLDGHIHQLRLVDWTPVRFDAALYTDRKPGVRQRISQRAVQDIGSVGDASFISSLQGQLIGLFSDFGYRRIGIGCRLENQVCAMSGPSAVVNFRTGACSSRTWPRRS